MGPPGGGKSIITPRFQRHFNTIIFSLVDENTMKTIFSSILSYFFREGKFVKDICDMNEKIVMATLNVYRRIQEDLKPTPAKSHYTFNLRDVSKVICGICLMNAKELKNPDTAVRLWAHESTRVFGDRLINEDDRKWMLDSVTDCVRAPFGSDFNTLFRHLDSNHDGKVDSIDEFRGCLFGDIYTPFQMRERDYVEVLDKDKLKVCANGALEQYNGNADKPMNLVLFNFAVEHLLRIGRIIKQPNGHALLVGVGGSGRQSLTRLASAIPDYDVF
jgi:dynein heavy chain